MRCCIIPIAAQRPTRLRWTRQFPLPIQFFDSTGKGGRRAGLAPTGKRRLVTAHTRSGLRLSREKRSAGRKKYIASNPL
jgi:hypothetical protein